MGERKRKKGQPTKVELPQLTRENLSRCNKTELQLIYAEVFGVDVSRGYSRKEIIDAVLSGTPLEGDGVDQLRKYTTEIIHKYYRYIRYQLTCDGICVECPAGVVADCYLGFKSHYPDA